jgi:uncharacterized protein (TIGR02588 family)
MAEKENNSSEKKDQPIPFLEWLVAAIGLILVIGALGFTIYQAATGGKKPPILKVKSTNIEKTDAGYLVKFEVENTGDETAADVVIQGKLTKAAEEIETSSATLDYAPSHSKRGGGLYFKNDPQSADFEILAKSYQEP